MSNLLKNRENDKILELLEVKNETVKVILDTDTFNEIDDQFALVQMLFSKERINVLGINAAPFSMNNRSDNPERGMELSYDEIFRLLDKINFKKNNFVFKGSRSYVGFDKKAINSPAADNIIESALKCSETDPLYIIAIGAITNVTSAILKEPEIIKNIIVVWLGGNALYWPTNNEFNLKQDVGGAQVLFDSGVSLVMVPCKGVTSHLISTVPEIEKALALLGSNKLIETLQEYELYHLEGKIKPKLNAQDNSLATYAHKITSKDRFADWKLSAISLALKTKALAYRLPLTLKSDDLLIQMMESQALPYTEQEGLPGIITKIDKKGIYVQCGHGTLQITRLKINRGQGKAMSVAEFLNGYENSLTVGQELNSGATH